MKLKPLFEQIFEAPIHKTGESYRFKYGPFTIDCQATGHGIIMIGGQKIGFERNNHGDVIDVQKVDIKKLIDDIVSFAETNPSTKQSSV